MEQNKTGVIYCISINSRNYYGSTLNIISRKSSHFSSLKSNLHSNIELQEAYNKHGKESLKFEIIKTVPVDLLKKEELELISSDKKCFNYFGSPQRKVYKCKRCGNVWKCNEKIFSRKNKEPASCPQCRSYKWNVSTNSNYIKKYNKTVSYECTCNKCNHVWKPRTIIPAACPNCKCRKWNEKQSDKNN